MKQARLYRELVRQELEIEADADVETLAATLSNHAITETVVSGVHEVALRDRLAASEDSAELPADGSSGMSVAAGNGNRHNA